MIKVPTYKEILDGMIEELERSDVTVLSSSATMAVLKAISNSEALFYTNLAAAIKVPENMNWLGTPSSKKLVWPDGLPMSHSPKDGATWSNKDGDWVWDGFAEVWFKQAHGKYSYNDEYLKAKEGPAVCGCGSEKVGSNKHSDYCPKYEEE